MAISTGLVGCQPDTAYVQVVVENGYTLTQVADETVCSGEEIVLKTNRNGVGNAPIFAKNSTTLNGAFDPVSGIATLSSNTYSITYKPNALAANATTSRVDKLKYTAVSSSEVCPDVSQTFTVTVNPAHSIQIDESYGLNNADIDTLVVCEGDSVLDISSTFGGGTKSVVWTSTNGTFSHPNDTTTSYFPNVGRMTNTSFDTLYLETTNNLGGCPNKVRDSLLIRVRRAATLSVSPDTLVCEDGTVELSAQSTGFGDTVFWAIHNSVGNFANTTILDTTTQASESVIYQPSLISDTTANFRIDTIRYFTQNPPGICPAVEDTIFVTVYNRPSVDVADLTKERDTLYICEGIGLDLNGTYGGGAIGATWSMVDSQGVFSNIVNDTLAVYTPNEGVSGEFRIDTLLLTANVVAATCSDPVVDTLIVIVEKGPVVTAAIDSARLCEGDNIALKGTFGSVATGFMWSTKESGRGTFNVLTDTTAIYTPIGAPTGLGRSDIIYLTSNNGAANCLVATDSIDLFVVTKPKLDLGPDLSLCGNIEQELVPTTIGTSNQLTWTSNSGNFAKNPSPTGLYRPDFSIPTQVRTDGIIVTAQDSFGLCASIKDTMLVQVIELARVTIGEIGKVCEDDSLSLNPNYSGTSDAFTFSVSNNTGVVTVANNQLIYVPNENTGQVDRIDEVIINLGSVNVPGCPTQIDTVSVTVVNNPRATLVGDTTICVGEQANLLIENFGLIDNFRSSLSTSLINYPSVPPTITNGFIRDTILLATSLVDKFCPSVASEMVVTIIEPTTIQAGDDIEICTGFDVPLNGGLGLGANVATWSVLNDAGTFDDVIKLNAIYTPKPLGDENIRTDTLLLSSSNNLSCLSGTDMVLVTVKSTPDAVLGPNVTINEGEVVPITVNINNKVRTGIWSGRNGSFTNNQLASTTYRPDALGDLESRKDTIIYQGISEEPTCANVEDTLVVTVLANVKIKEVVDVDFCRSLCLDTLATNLIAATGTVMVPANDIEPFDTCEVVTDYDFRFWSPSFGINAPTFVKDFDILPDSIQFDCSTRGFQDLDVFVAIDSLTIQRCPVTIDVFDSFLSCGERTVAGRITTINGDPLEGFDVLIKNTGLVGGVIPSPVKTDADGYYEFTLNVNATYEITPQNNEDLVAGVTAFDNVIITRHILGVEPFTSPFQTIAADVNKSGTVTAYDIVLIRKVVLARDNEFENNTSWRFVDADYEFPDVASAASAPFMESFMVSQNMGNVFDMDFIAVKIGDVNGTVDPNGLGKNLLTATDRNEADNIILELENRRVEKGQVYEIPFYLKDAEQVQAYQFTLNFTDLKLLDIREGIVSEDHFGLNLSDKGYLTTCWSTVTPQKGNQPWFTLQFTAQADGWLKEMLTLNSQVTPIEAYTVTQENVGVSLAFQEPASSNFELFQNRPNPFQNQTTVGFTLPTATNATIRIVDVQGKMVQVIDGNFAKGYNEVQIDLSDVAKGIYYYRLESEFGTKTRKLMNIETY